MGINNPQYISTFLEDGDGGYLYTARGDDGTIRETSKHDNLGRCHGERIFYDDDGTIISHAVYINGEFHANYEDLSEIDRFELSLKWSIVWS